MTQYVAKDAECAASMVANGTSVAENCPPGTSEVALYTGHVDCGESVACDGSDWWEVIYTDFEPQGGCPSAAEPYRWLSVRGRNGPLWFTGGLRHADL